MDDIQLTYRVPDECSGHRLDAVAAKLFPHYSRSMFKRWIEVGHLSVNGMSKKPKDKVKNGDLLALHVVLENTDSMQAEAMPLTIVFEDEHIIIVNKAKNLVVHPAAGHPRGTLLNGLLHHCPALRHVPRAGIVHRLDKNTTGLMVVAKTLKAHTCLVRQLQQGTVKRQYSAVVTGIMTAGGRIEASIGRHPTYRLKMAVTESGKHAVTRYRVIQRFRKHTHIDVFLETGRTHQIRVHMSALRYPLVGDALYGYRPVLPKQANAQLMQVLACFKHQALHAKCLGLLHPIRCQHMEWEANYSEDFCRFDPCIATGSAGISGIEWFS